MAWPLPKTFERVMHGLRAPQSPLPQQPFRLVTPMARAALLLGAAGGFVLASVLSLTLALHARLGPWWAALAQAHGRLQVFGWVGLFIFSVAFHFLPRLRGAGLRWPRLAPWVLGALASGLLLRAVSQPLLTIWPGARLWQAALILSGALEALGIGLALTVLAGTFTQPGAPPLRKRPALWGVLPFLGCVGAGLALAALVNLLNVVQAARGVGIVSAAADDISVTLGLFGFLVPMALAMSARALPLYAGLESIPQRILWPTAFVYAAGLALALIGMLGEPDGPWANAGLARVGGLGLVVIGLTLVCFIAYLGRMMGARGRLPGRVRDLAPQPEQRARNYTRHVSAERAKFGPYVALIGSAYAWAFLAGLLLTVDGVALALGALPLVSLDAARHSIAVGFIALLLAGVSVRMIPGFSGGSIASPRLVEALLWLGNGAALLRVGSLLALPALATLGSGGTGFDNLLFGVSGLVGLTFAITLAITLWPALPMKPAAAPDAG